MHARLYMSSRSILRSGLAPVWVSMTCTYGSGRVYIISLRVCVWIRNWMCSVCPYLHMHVAAVIHSREQQAQG